MLTKKQLGIEDKGTTLYRCTTCGVQGAAWLRLQAHPETRIRLSPGNWTRYVGTVEIDGCRCKQAHVGVARPCPACQVAESVKGFPGLGSITVLRCTCGEAVG